MSARFQTCFSFSLGEEIGPYGDTGGYVSAERAAQIGDRGGETWSGIARTFNPKWPGWLIIDRLKSYPEFPKNLPKDAELVQLRADLYRTNYWDRFHCGEMPPGLDLALFDASVQHLPIPAAKIFQQAVGARDDGQIGDGTIQAAWNADKGYALERYFVIRTMFYMDILVSKPATMPNRDGWFGRLFRLQKYILEGKT